MLDNLKKIRKETFRLKFRNLIWLPRTREWRRKKLDVDAFTIISNNCWGGTIYESYGMRKDSPTIGMFIMPADFVKFCAHLDCYLALPLEFIEPSQSKWESTLRSKDNWGTYLIGRLGDIELHMLHYHDEAIAERKWNSRVGRIHRDRIIYKFNDQNGATEDDLLAFDALPLANKLVFSAQAHPTVRCAHKIHCPMGCGFIPASYEPFGRNLSFDVNQFINDCFASK